MLKNISITFIYKVLNAILGFVNTILITQFLGATGKGIFTIFIANVGLSLLINNIIGGKSIVLLNNKIPTSNLLITTYIWVIFSSVITVFLLNKFSLTNSNYFIQLLIISILYGLHNTHIMCFLGKQQTLLYNIQASLPTVFQFITSIILLYVFNNKNIIQFIEIQYYVYGLSFFISLIYIIPSISKPDKITLKSIYYLWQIGFKSQFSNIIQFLNNRVLFYFVGYYLTKSDLGIYSVGVALTEVILIMSNSISMVAYAKIANTTNIEEINNSIKPYIKLSFGITFLGLISLVICPNYIYSAVFGNEFNNLKQTILYLIPGTLGMSLYYVASSYFNGIAKFKFNNLASIICLSILIISGLLFIPNGNIFTTAIITSIAYLCMCGYVFILFAKAINLTFKDMMISKKDINHILTLIKK